MEFKIGKKVRVIGRFFPRYSHVGKIVNLDYSDTNRLLVDIEFDTPFKGPFYSNMWYHTSNLTLVTKKEILIKSLVLRYEH